MSRFSLIIIIRLLLKLHRDRDLSILFISHDLRVIYQMCDRALVMRDGQIVEEGEVSTLYSHPTNAYTRQLLEAAGISQ